MTNSDKKTRRIRHKFLTAATAALLPALAAGAAAPAGVTLRASVDSTVVVMGDVTGLHLQAVLPTAFLDSARVTDLPAPDSEFAGLDVVSVKADTVRGDAGGRSTVDYTLTVQAFDPGTLTIPPFGMVVGSAADTAFSQVLTLKVLPVDVDSLETIHPLRGTVSAQTRWYDYIPTWLPYLLLGLLALGLIGVGVLYAFMGKKIIPEKAKPVIPPYDLAVSRLNELQARKLPENGHEKEYYTELVDILRQYLHGRFGINAMEMTSTQIVRSLRANEHTRMTAEEMRPVLAMADFVKFAKVRPMPEDNVKSYNTAVNFLEQTKPAPEPEEPAAADGEAAKTGRKTNDKNK